VSCQDGYIWRKSEVSFSFVNHLVLSNPSADGLTLVFPWDIADTSIFFTYRVRYQVMRANQLDYRTEALKLADMIKQFGIGS
jgi:hypothetical protein